jgi:16S rRNA pseudouridine516 synthase
MSQQKTLRLDRLLANMGYGSRREIQFLVSEGLITLDGAELTKADQHIPLSRDLSSRLMIDGALIDPIPGMVIMLHKPLGVTCSHKDVGPLVYDLLPERWRRREPAISTIGRLDKDTSGLLLLTDDGGFLHRIISPKHHIEKRYQVGLAQPLRGDEAELFAAGTMMLEGEEKPLLPAALEVHSATTCALTITEGRYHQVRRMFAAVGNHVSALHRDKIGQLLLPSDLAAGDLRVLTPEALAQIL